MNTLFDLMGTMWKNWFFTFFREISMKEKFMKMQRQNPFDLTRKIAWKMVKKNREITTVSHFLTVDNFNFTRKIVTFRFFRNFEKYQNYKRRKKFVKVCVPSIRIFFRILISCSFEIFIPKLVGSPCSTKERFSLT